MYTCWILRGYFSSIPNAKDCRFWYPLEADVSYVGAILLWPTQAKVDKKDAIRVAKTNGKGNLDIMEEQFKQDICLNCFRFHSRLDYLSDVFNYAEKYRFQRHTELSKLVSENTYSEFVEKFGMNL